MFLDFPNTQCKPSISFLLVVKHQHRLAWLTFHKFQNASTSQSQSAAHLFNHETNTHQLSSLLLILLTAPLLTIAQVTSTNQALFPGLRITSHTPKPASAVLSALYNEIGPAPAPTTRLSQLVSSITGFDAANKQRFIAGLEAILGKVGFTIIAVSCCGERMGRGMRRC